MFIAPMSKQDEGEENHQLATRPPSGRWSIHALADACQRMQVDLEETNDFSVLSGLVVTCGRTSLISIRASLSEAEKIFTLAHELGHIALGQTKRAPVQHRWGDEQTPIPFLDHQEDDREADIWAAHLLVRPDVFRRCLEEAQAEWGEGSLAATQAIRRTADLLNIPLHAVHLWRDHQDWTFNEAPGVWLARGGGN